MTDTVDIVVVGGGISGVSLAARLSERFRVAVLEAEPHLGTHATGRSAALLVETYGPGLIRRLTSMSRSFFESPPKGFSEVALGRRRGMLIYGGEADRTKLRQEFEISSRTGLVEWLDGDAVLALCSLLRPGIAAAGFLEPNSLDLDANALLQGFARSLRQNGAEIVVSALVRQIARQPGGWHVHADSRSLACRILVNAAGAWADEVAALAGVTRCGLIPMRRTAATIGVPDELAALLPSHPFVAPVDDSYYFKPDAGAIMVSLSDETPSAPMDAYAEDLDVATALERFHAATVVPPARPIATWAGLRTFAGDRLPVVGFDEAAPGFFWYAGQGGYGIQTSPALSTLGAKIMAGDALDPGEAEIVTALSPKRFSRRAF